jgi:hypothetical protein
LIPAGIVAAKELGALSVSGPGIKGELLIEDGDQLVELEQSGFLEGSFVKSPPDGLGEGYAITQFLNMEAGPIEWQQLVYYPAAPGEQGYLYRVGPLNPDAPQAADQWRRIKPAANDLFRSILESHKVAVESAVPAVLAEAPAQPAAAPQVAAPEAAAPQVVAPAVPQPEQAEAAGPAAVSPPAAAPAPAPNIGLVWIIGLLAALVAGLGLARWLSAQRQGPPVESIPAEK